MMFSYRETNRPVILESGKVEVGGPGVRLRLGRLLVRFQEHREGTGFRPIFRAADRTKVLASFLFMMGAFCFSCLSQSSVPLAWDPSPSAGVINYNVRYGTTTLSYTKPVSAGNSTKATITGLTAGTTYFFVAT